MQVYVAYNFLGDLIAEGDTEWELECNLAELGYSLDEVQIGRANP
jgi:hypothetical protein